MLAKVGKITKFEKGVGEITSPDGKYLFTIEDIKENNHCDLNDIVMFRGEEVQNKKRAFFVQKISKENTKDLPKILLKMYEK